jgi:serine/threonine protein phosphatase PrpC
MHDDLLLEPAHPECNPTVPLFGVYDGHGGGAAAQHCARRLHHFVAAKLQRLLHGPGGGGEASGEGGGGGEDAAASAAATPKDGDGHRHRPSPCAAAAAAAAAGAAGAPPACPLDSAAVEVALREAFVETDAELMRSGVLDHNSGSTALVALLTPASIWLAWAGASRGTEGWRRRRAGVLGLCGTDALRRHLGAPPLTPRPC